MVFSMNLPFGVPASAGPGRLKAPEGGTPYRWQDPDRFMVPMRGIKVVGALHEPTRSSNCNPPLESGAEDARTPDASRPPGVSEPREASGVRPIYRRFRTAAGRRAVHGPNACEKTKGGSP